MAYVEPGNRNSRGGLKGYQVLLWMAGFFGMMFAVNGLFLFYAITTFPGEDVKKSYIQGLDYNTTLAERAAQAQLNWQAEIGVVGQSLEVRILDNTGTGVPGHDVQVQFRRLATTSEDTVVMAAPQGAGVYRVDLSAFSAGQWEVIAHVRRPGADESLFEARKQVGIE